jgi:hypothetical protein
MPVQSGQKKLTGWPASGQLRIGNKGPQIVFLPQAAGTVILNGATPVAVADAGLSAGSIVLFTLKSVNAGTVGAYPNLVTVTPGTGFTVAGTAGDTGIYNWVRLG